MRVDGHVHDDRKVVGLPVQCVGHLVRDRVVGGGEDGTVEAHTILSQSLIRTFYDVHTVAAVVEVRGYQDDVETVV